MFLGLSYVVMSYLAAYIWILLLIAALMVTVAIFMVKRFHSQRDTSAPVTRDVPVTQNFTSDTTE